MKEAEAGGAGDRPGAFARKESFEVSLIEHGARRSRRRRPRGPAKTDARILQFAAPETGRQPTGLHDPALYINRELSWLAFNDRVLAQALDSHHPLLERVKFLAIVGLNLDEFFMVRVATLLRKFRAGLEDMSPDGLSTDQQLQLVRERAARMLNDQAACWSRTLRPLLAEQGIDFLDGDDYSPGVVEYLARHFAAQISPVLTPLAFDPGHPFPYISNRSKNLAVAVRSGGRTRFARVKVPDVLPRFIPLPPALTGGRTTFVFLEDVIRRNLAALFPGVPVRGAYLFRIVRDTDMVIQEDEADDLLETVDRGLRQLRHGALSLLQVDAGMPRRVLNILMENFEVEEEVVVRTADRMGYSDWMELLAIHRPELKDPPAAPRFVWQEEGEALFQRIRHRDQLVHHPFDSFAAVETFLEAAVDDPQVIAIKMTLYRIGADSPLVDLLIRAAEAGKQVAVLVELKARFDERNNILWASRLESAGIHVVYGLVNLKTHCKLCLVVRKETGGIRRYAHVSTGNYNAETARVYTDIGLFTAREPIMDDVTEVFNYLTGYSNKRDYGALLVAPVNLRKRLTELIEREAAHAVAGRPARLIFKVNAVTDPAMIRSLYQASQAGVPIDLISRGVCCLRPGVPGVSETIRVRSIVGRLLEHSRIYFFENGGEPEVYIGSADLMERNLDRRVEVLCPIEDPALRDYLRGIVLDAYLRDTDRASALHADGSFEPVRPADGEAPFNAQQYLLEWHAAQDAVAEQ